eukprot:746076-Hanusia_phi.AAC.5
MTSRFVPPLSGGPDIPRLTRRSSGWRSELELLVLILLECPFEVVCLDAYGGFPSFFFQCR